MPDPLAQVRRVENGDEEIGMGFDSASEPAIGTALEGFTVQANPVASGQEVRLVRQTGFAELVGRLGGFY
jgi:hypothetical protein